MSDLKPCEKEKEQLKACPFCGGAADIYEHTGKIMSWHYTAQVECESCDSVKTPVCYGLSKEEAYTEAAAAWNTRTEPLANARLAMLTEALKSFMQEADDDWESDIEKAEQALNATEATAKAWEEAKLKPLQDSILLLDNQGNRLLKALEAEEIKNTSLEAENERLKQQVTILRDAIAKRLSNPNGEGFPLIEAYKATQPPKEGG